MKRNRLYRSDCKVVTEELKKEGIKVDLIYLDPPFNSNRTYSMIFNHGGITAQQKAYHDMWDFTDSTRQLVLDFRDELDKWELPESFKDFMRAWLKILEGGTADDRKLLNYLMYMTQRLIRLHDILKPTGAIYFHCDPTASHYIKVIMDGIFGRKNFRNEVIWDYTFRMMDLKRIYNRKHDIILFYAKLLATRITMPKTSWTREEVIKTRKQKVHVDDDGEEWIWMPGGKGKSKSRLKKIRDIVADGKAVSDVWAMPTLSSSAKERRGYDTQKPLPLLERIVLASSRPGDTVLDPFCGCGTSVHAAEKHGRRWIGIDISGDAVDEIRDRLGELGVYDKDHYDVLEGSPDTMAEYTRLNAYEKQDWLIRKLGGLPNPKKSGDGGKDGDMTFHMGTDEQGSDTWGRMLFSVKTGKQRSPAHVRELRGAMKNDKAQIGILIVDADPTPGMEKAAAKAGRFTYQPISNMPPKSYDKIQVITSYEIIDGAQLDCPPTMQSVKRYRKAQTEMRV